MELNSAEVAWLVACDLQLNDLKAWCEQRLLAELIEGREVELPLNIYRFRCEEYQDDWIYMHARTRAECMWIIFFQLDAVSTELRDALWEQISGVGYNCRWYTSMSRTLEESFKSDYWSFSELPAPITIKLAFNE